MGACALLASVYPNLREQEVLVQLLDSSSCSMIFKNKKKIKFIKTVEAPMVMESDTNMVVESSSSKNYSKNKEKTIEALKGTCFHCGKHCHQKVNYKAILGRRRM